MAQRYTCQVCGGTFGSAGALAEHIRVKHMRARLAAWLGEVPRWS